MPIASNEMPASGLESGQADFDGVGQAARFAIGRDERELGVCHALYRHQIKNRVGNLQGVWG
ncbi:MAG: hypothetical protein DLM69_11165 [Candidatus Chloroheliales bacterium]|nr:MAG: hypothetical protein DLM69_11165 [Chloroflexota bacterium]